MSGYRCRADSTAHSLMPTFNLAGGLPPVPPVASPITSLSTTSFNLAAVGRWCNKGEEYLSCSDSSSCSSAGRAGLVCSTIVHGRRTCSPIAGAWL